ncbi:unnamed protein product [Sphenostylis stenocarpa]|uniref:Uncharacterized protein n=1 Tax=Sphenostylis stenocarpa TaxID=92480 RepID=A0AA86T2Z9_9FABA|nr:unnamed protein product [Sphenostylis stenocarpa]
MPKRSCKDNDTGEAIRTDSNHKSIGGKGLQWVIFLCEKEKALLGVYLHPLVLG